MLNQCKDQQTVYGVGTFTDDLLVLKHKHP